MRLLSLAFAGLSFAVGFCIGSFELAFAAFRSLFVNYPAFSGRDALHVDRIGHSLALDDAPAHRREHQSFLTRAMNHARFFGDGFKLDRLASPA